ncbi:MAG TPA: YraN family protein [Pirellulaceae bacterium]|nr:YraN family protein [Pirellulaceae bacterium]HMO93954.1 YraN family protein [Pirellulaceae bacterium]HMP67960.1 YraN family protein [Pirellulaceae bacterium]
MKIVGRNYRDRMGEIDIVAVDKRTVVFVEVKCRTSDDHGAGFEAVDEKKQQKMARTALTFLQRHDLLENAYRFDIVSMLWPPNQSQPQIEHFPNAFQPTAKNQMFG